VKFRWPFSKKRNERWVGINLSSLTPSAVIYSNEGIVDAVTYDQEQGIDALALWLKQHVTHGISAVLVLDDDDYDLLLVEAPNVPDEELNAAIEFRIGDLLAQPIEETAIQTLRLPREAYRGRMSMAHVIACPDETIKKRVRWANKLHLAVEIITVPELSLLNVLAASSIDQGIALLELGPNHGCIRLYQNGALFLTRQVEMGIDVLDINSAIEETSFENASFEDGDHSDINLEEMNLSDFTSENSDSGDDFESSELQLEVAEDDWTSYKESYVGFSPKAQVNGQQLENLVLEVQRSLDYYESQLGMGQITQLWLMGGDTDLKDLVDAMQPLLTAHIEQPDIADKLAKKVGMEVPNDIIDINKSVTALGGALAYVTR
jgi:MSHA biogenesis protein MshI